VPELIDSHAHLTDERLAAEVHEIVGRAKEAEVTSVVTVGTTVPDSRAAVGLAASIPGVFATVGIHPHSAGQGTDHAFAELRELARSPGVVAIGETGLDFYYDNAPREAQVEAFLRQLDLARELDLPVVVHSRDADTEVSAILRDHGRGTVGVLHCFSGGPGLLEAGLDAGWSISFGGMITFPKYADAELLRVVPDDRLLVETDSPYLAPVPLRGRRNEPANVALVAIRAAQLRGVAPDELATATTANARRLFRLSSPES
jgi:TatD DNase family protein